MLAVESREKIPELPAPQIIAPDELITAFRFEEGFHHPDWKLVHDWVRTHVSTNDLDEAWNEVALLWVTGLRDDLGGDYFILTSRRIILLCDQPLEMAQWLLDYADTVMITAREYLREAAWTNAHGRHVLIVFSEDDDYYQYISHYCPDGEQAASGGVCIHSGYVHSAIPFYEASDAANAVSHELIHANLAHLSLPLWLNEGVAVTLQRLIAPPRRAPTQSDQQSMSSAFINWRPPMMWHELAERHFAFWNEENIQTFWAGTSFYVAGESNQLSYNLAEVFLKLLSERGDAAALRSFLQAARRDDAGQTAALDILGVDLGEIAGTFLGAGNWRPQRKAMAVLWEAAGWKTQSS